MANSKARSTAYVSFDGRNQQELRVGDRSVLLFRKRLCVHFLSFYLSLSFFLSFFLSSYLHRDTTMPHCSRHIHSFEYPCRSLYQNSYRFSCLSILVFSHLLFIVSSPPLFIVTNCSRYLHHPNSDRWNLVFYPFTTFFLRNETLAVLQGDGTFSPVSSVCHMKSRHVRVWRPPSPENDRSFTFLCSFQSAGDHVYIPGAQHLCRRPNYRLVRLPGGVPALERTQKAETPG